MPSTFRHTSPDVRPCHAAAPLGTPYCDVIVQRWEAFTGKKAKRQAAVAVA